jgi:hypothetical protein
MLQKKVGCTSDPRMSSSTLQDDTFNPEDGDNMFLQNVRIDVQGFTKKKKTAIWTITALKRSKLMLHWSNAEVEMSFQNNADAIRQQRSPGMTNTGYKDIITIRQACEFVSTCTVGGMSCGNGNSFPKWSALELQQRPRVFISDQSGQVQSILWG